MLSNQVLSKVIADIHKIIGADCSIWSVSGKCLMSTDEDYVGMKDKVQSFLADAAGEQESITKQGAFFVVNASFLPLSLRICSLTFVFFVIFFERKVLFLNKNI